VESKIKSRVLGKVGIAEVFPILCLFIGSAVASPFQNESFELPGGVSNIQLLGCGDTFVTGWINNASSCTGLQEYQQGNAINQNIAAEDGTFHVEFGGNGTTGGTLQQTFDTLIGDTYQVNYFLALGDHSAGANFTPHSLMVQAFDGMNLLGTAADNDFTHADWENGPTLTFTAASAMTTLIFTDITDPAIALADENNIALDNVTVSVVGTPEPSTLALTALPLLAGLWFARQRIGPFPDIR
jgi:hypothetical protein